jgi:hypothetical protein
VEKDQDITDENEETNEILVTHDVFLLQRFLDPRLVRVMRDTG